MAELVGIDWTFPDLGARFKRREQEILLFVAAQLQTNRGLMFDTANAGRPTPWEKPKFRDGQPLSANGTLRKSFAPRNDGQRPVKGPDGIVRVQGEKVTIGTMVAYGPIHNEGGVIRPKRFPVLWIPIPNGKANSSQAPTKLAKSLIKGAKKGERGNGAPIVKGRDGRYYLLAKKATIPKRPMDEWTQADQEELEIALRNKLEEVLNGE